MLGPERLKISLEEYIKTQQWKEQPVGLYEPIRYIMGIGGKRLRPLFLMISHQLFKLDTKKALPAAFALELFHNFSLVHDDIMDEAIVRRGHRSVHAAYGINTGILSGDVMLIYVYEYLLKNYPPNLSYNLLEVFNGVAIEVCEGQQLDMDFEKMDRVGMKEYIGMIRQKTAVLFGGALKMGAIIGGANETDQQALYDFGCWIGTAFQLQDDILDLYGDPDFFGKKVGGDIVQNKKTILVIQAINLAKDNHKQRLRDLLSASDEITKVEEAVRLFNELGVKQKAEEIRDQYISKAWEMLNKLSVPDEGLDILRSISNKLIHRIN